MFGRFPTGKMLATVGYTKHQCSSHKRSVIHCTESQKSQSVCARSTTIIVSISAASALYHGQMAGQVFFGCYRPVSGALYGISKSIGHYDSRALKRIREAALSTTV